MTTVIKVNLTFLYKARCLQLERRDFVVGFRREDDFYLISSMAKGRSFAPQPRGRNHWFCAKPLSSPVESQAKSTFKPIPPRGYKAKERLQVPQHQFPFSKHDNRNAFQDHGIYFGNGLGRRFLQQQRNKCSGSLLPLVTTNPQSCYAASFTAPTISDEVRQFRRYTHNHLEKSTAQMPNTETNLLKSVNTRYTTPLNVLAISQEPFLQANTWVYSYKPKEYNRFLGL